MHHTTMKEGWKIHQIQEIQPLGECALVCEDIATSSLVFFQIVDLVDNEIVLQPLSQHVTDADRKDITESDPITSYRSMMCYL